MILTTKKMMTVGEGKMPKQNNGNKEMPRPEEKDHGRNVEITYISEGAKKPDWIEERNNQIMEMIWTIFLSMVTAIITVVLTTK
jgi:hypothetical protein|nr:MAG TPA: hypothetical protein [Caudoviricetes sp.]